MDHKQYFAELYSPAPHGEAGPVVTQLDAADAASAIRQANAWAVVQMPTMTDPMLIRVIVDGQTIYDGPFGELGDDEPVLPPN